MANVTVTVRIAFASDPFTDAPTWTDVSHYAYEIHIQRGRQHELGRIEAGTAIVMLRNATGVFWPGNTGGAYYGYILPGKRLNIRATYGGTTYDLFTGFIESWQPQWVGKAENGAVMCVTCSDLLKNLATCELNDATGFPSELSGQRVIRVLESLGWVFSALTVPASHSDADAVWNDEANAYDDDDATYAYVACTDDGHYLELTMSAAMDANAVRILAYERDGTGTHEPYNVSMDYYDGSTWTNFWASASDGELAEDRWNLVSFGAKVNITKIRIAMDAGSTNQWLRLLGIEAGLSGIEPGQTTLPASGALANVNALDHLRDVQDAERGIVFIAGDGDVQFHSRHHRLLSEYASAATFGDDAGESFYVDIAPSYDDTYIYNDVRMTRAGGTEQTASDATSQTAYGKRTHSQSDLLLTSDAEALSMAEYLLSQYKDPALRAASITLMPDKAPADLFPKVLGYDIGERVTVRLDHAYIDEDYHIEGIRHDHTRDSEIWQAQWQLGNADSIQYWAIGRTGLSEIGETTRVAY